ncbi:MAG TPA: DUF4252 domain-containing protein [Bacteroidales bacterium]|nr:DUF4252 domain-containing protein [Bacteroidales bacterium]
MKKLVIIPALLLCFSCVNGQKSIDRLFEKYSDNDGFTCVSISGNLLNIAATLEDDDEHDRDIKAKITGVRILAQKDHSFDAGNFHDIIMKDIDLDDYEEFLQVRESDQDLRMLVKTQGRRIVELLIIAGGDDNALVQVKGDMSASDARKLCENARKNHGSITIN